MGIRAFRKQDTSVLLSMWNASARFDPLTPGLLDEKIHRDGDYEPELVLVSEEDGAVTGFIMGVLRKTAEGPRGIVKLAAVAANRRRRGIGSHLLSMAEEALRDRGARTVRVCESAPNYLTPGVDCRYTSAPYFFEKHGYRRWGEACNMTVDLAERTFSTGEAERALAADGIGVRRAEPADERAVMSLLDVNWPPWKAEAGTALRNKPSSLHLAIRDGRVLAFAAWDANNRGTGWFGPMGTAPEARGNGIGGLLLFRCLADMKAAGHRYATIPWVEPVRFYEVCAGAAVSRIFNRYEKVLEP